MLRIVCGESASESTTLKLEGRVIGPWVEEVKRASEEVLASGATLILDLSEVSFVDREGIELFRNLSDRRALFQNTSVFVAEQLKSGRGEGDGI
jgi:anti-anti-sigma regulatory factor